MVSPEDDTGGIGVKKENCGLGRRLAEKVVLDGEIEVGILGAGDVDLGGGVRISSCASKISIFSDVWVWDVDSRDEKAIESSRGCHVYL